MNTFSVVINGMIEGISHRFHGGSGEPEIYHTDNGQEIGILRGCLYATEEIPEVELGPEEELEKEDEDDVTVPGEASPEAVESATLREKLLEISMRELQSAVKGMKIMELGMNQIRLVDAILEHSEIAREITGV